MGAASDGYVNGVREAQHVHEDNRFRVGSQLPHTRLPPLEPDGVV